MTKPSGHYDQFCSWQVFKQCRLLLTRLIQNQLYTQLLFVDHSSTSLVASVFCELRLCLNVQFRNWLERYLYVGLFSLIGYTSTPRYWSPHMSCNHESYHFQLHVMVDAPINDYRLHPFQLSCGFKCTSYMGGRGI